MWCLCLYHTQQLLYIAIKEIPIFIVILIILGIKVGRTVNVKGISKEKRVTCMIESFDWSWIASTDTYGSVTCISYATLGFVHVPVFTTA